MVVKRRRRLTSEEPAVHLRLIKSVASHSQPLQTPGDLDPLMQRIGDARYVLLGEASHGTHEYYDWRTAISRRLIEEKGFWFIAVEGDWPDCYRANQYVKGDDGGEDAREVLHQFDRWPTWMWSNEEIILLLEWLRVLNRQRPDDQKVGFFGLDVYSLWDSLYHLLGYLRQNAPASLPAAHRALQCFEPYGEDVQAYARATRWADASCEDHVVDLLTEVRRSLAKSRQDGHDSRLNAEQNAWVIHNADRYYRTMVQGGAESWNVRDRHMVDTLERLMQHHGPDAKAIVWEHNTHVGDARYTDMAEDGMVNVGQLVREQHPESDVVLVGFGSYQGSVIAGREWEAPMERMRVPAARSGSWEDVLHQAGDGDRLLILDAVRKDPDWLEERGHRAIGVVYRPQFESYGNYVPTTLPRRYDAFLFCHRTQALRPLRELEIHTPDLPETYPTGM